jgi:hypothetical protein
LQFAVDVGSLGLQSVVVVAALDAMLALDADDDSPGGPLALALAATAIPATLAAWAAAALRCGGRSQQALLGVNIGAFVGKVGALLGAAPPAADAGAGGGCGARPRPPALCVLWPDVRMPPLPEGATWGPLEFEHIAREVMPAIAAALRAAQAAAEGPESRLRLAARVWDARALGALPCANPGCLRVSGCRERDERNKRCSGCKSVRYCCRECQVAAWKAHRKVCGALAAEREAAECAGGSGEE